MKLIKPTEFPKDFVWGVASSALQVEGADSADGKSATIWDAVNLKPGQVEDGSSPAVSCDFYHRYKQDIRLLTFRISAAIFAFGGFCWLFIDPVTPIDAGTATACPKGFPVIPVRDDPASRTK